MSTKFLFCDKNLKLRESNPISYNKAIPFFRELNKVVIKLLLFNKILYKIEGFVLVMNSPNYSIVSESMNIFIHI